MGTVTPEPRVLLLVEDNPADADLVEELLEQAGSEPYTILRSTRLSDAIGKLHGNHIDVVLLDLRLPDGAGLSSVQSIRGVDKQIPIVVLTGIEDETLAMSCINAGAQDYICKGDLRTASLRRSLGYAISRIREAQLREIQETLARYRSLSNQTSQTSVTAALAGTGAVRERYPGAFSDVVHSYVQLLESYYEWLVYKKDKPRETMENIVTALGDAGAGPRDLVDVHVGALDLLTSGAATRRASSLLIEARLLALEMMGLLVDYYRVGLRRRRPGRGKP